MLLSIEKVAIWGIERRNRCSHEFYNRLASRTVNLAAVFHERLDHIAPDLVPSASSGSGEGDS